MVEDGEDIQLANPFKSSFYILIQGFEAPP
jgi:hypothetical protein